MKRITDSRRHAPVFCSETVKGGNGFGVAQHHGDLTALGAQDGLPLRSGLGLGGHGLALGRSCAPLLHVGNATLGNFEAGPSMLNNAIHVDVKQAVGVGFDLELGAAGEVLHFVLRVGPIPTVETSYPVTSDKSTPNATVRREAA